MNLKELSIIELKAHVYDQLALSENCKRNIELINQEIIRRDQKSNDIKKKPEKKPVIVEESK